MPLKRAVLRLLDGRTPLVAEVGAANTVIFDAGRRCGHNTDVPGMIAALAEAGPRTAARHPSPGWPTTATRGAHPGRGRDGLLRAGRARGLGVPAATVAARRAPRGWPAGRG